LSIEQERIQFISREKAESLLLPLGLRIGSWNQITETGDVSAQRVQFFPGRGGSELYVLAHHLSKWVARNGWVLIQFDNSTLPLDFEIDTLSFIFSHYCGRWDFLRQKSILVNPTNVSIKYESVSLMIFFGLLFEWHFYLVGENSDPGRRLGIQDGVVYFFGITETLVDARELIEQVTQNPLKLPDGYHGQ